jgi:hypothetical protein
MKTFRQFVEQFKTQVKQGDIFVLYRPWEGDSNREYDIIEIYDLENDSYKSHITGSIGPIENDDMLAPLPTNLQRWKTE